jgi:hypothetical protein
MKKSLLFLFVTLFFVPVAYAQDADEAESTESEETSAAEETPAIKPGGPKTMSGMSILGNEETPKSLVIVPWKSSEMGDEMSLSDTLDERAQPVDKEVFLRKLNFYQIRSDEQ